jgi:hypothetical protein
MSSDKKTSYGLWSGELKKSSNMPFMLAGQKKSTQKMDPGLQFGQSSQFIAFLSTLPIIISLRLYLSMSK